MLEFRKKPVAQHSIIVLLSYNIRTSNVLKSATGNISKVKYKLLATTETSRILNNSA